MNRDSPAQPRVRIDSEIGPLRSVVIHTPGSEIESMTPKTAAEVLYNDIIPLGLVSNEHRLLKEFLSRVCDVFEVGDLLDRAFAGSAGAARRAALLDRIAGAGPARERRGELDEMDASTLVRTVIGGLHARDDSIAGVLAGRQYDLPPLPNIYFMRDSSFVVRDRYAVSTMAYAVRSAEAEIMRAVLDSIAGSDAALEPCPVSIEGGDVVVLGPTTIAIGVSERTTAAAIDALAARLSAAFEEPIDLIVVVLPRERSTIHLDMVFTMVDREQALVYEPHVVGPRRAAAYTMRLEPGRAARIDRHDGLLDALRQADRPVTTIACGGSDPVTREREQWLSAANVVSFAPGKVIGYDCNVATMDAFSSAGYDVVDVRRFTDGDDAPDSHERLFVAMPGVNLARGGGGPRCMTLPLERDPIDR